MLAEQPAIEALKVAQNSQIQAPVDVPVRFTAFENNVSNSYATAALDIMNGVFAPAGINLVLCGDINFVSDARIMAETDVDRFVSSFSYTSGAMEVYLKPGAGKPYGFIPFAAYAPGNPNFNLPYTEHNNIIRLAGPGHFGVTFIHEIGHHFGLLHTFHVAQEYNVPMVGDNTDDYPYPVIENNGQIKPNWWGRELVIRSNLDPNDPLELRPFKLINYKVAGDLIEDTPPDCGTEAGQSSVWPGCLISVQNQSTCELDASLTYQDYNGDAIYPPQPGMSLGRNFMSYWRTNCINQFTPEQYVNLAYYKETAREPFYTFDKCGTFTDKVEFESSATPLHNVTLRVRHPNDSRKCNVTSSLTGNYSGILHTDDLMIHAYHNGKGALEFPNDKLKVHYGHKKCEWKEGVDPIDLFLISQHILNNQPFTSGYSMIAADANQNNSISTFDIVQLRKMILEDNYFIPGVEQPWRFIPEFVPQSFTASFNKNPFSLLAGGYLQQGWLFQSPPIGQRGFDGIKIGDVNSSWPVDPAICGPEGPPNNPSTTSAALPSFMVPSTSLAQDQVVKLAFKVQDFNLIKAFQLGINLPFEKFEVLDVIEISLPAYNKEDYFGLSDLESNEFKTLWFDEVGTGQSLQNGDKLFSMVVRAKQAIPNLQEQIALDNSILRNFFWGNTTSTTSIIVEVEPATANRSSNSLTSSKLPNPLYCNPSPFTDNLLVLFENSEIEAEANISIFNMAGVSIRSQKATILQGENTLQINNLSDLPSGNYILSFSLNGKQYNKKIVKQ